MILFSVVLKIIFPQLVLYVYLNDPKMSLSVSEISFKIAWDNELFMLNTLVKFLFQYYITKKSCKLPEDSVLHVFLHPSTALILSVLNLC